MTFYSVEEYVIEENEFEFDEDENEFVQTDFIDTLETTSMEIEVVENPAMKQLVFIPAWKRRKRQQTSMTETESPI